MKLSLEIPCYNEAANLKLLFEKLDNFRNFSKSIEVIIVDNGSTDNSKDIIKKLRGDGLLVCTPAGSTAYNLSVHGPILSLNSGKLAVTPISPFRPRRWKGKVISNKLNIKIQNLNPTKRPIAVVADNVEIRNIKSLKIKVNKNIKIALLHDKNRSLVKRIKIS